MTLPSSLIACLPAPSFQARPGPCPGVFQSFPLAVPLREELNLSQIPAKTVEGSPCHLIPSPPVQENQETSWTMPKQESSWQRRGKDKHLLGVPRLNSSCMDAVSPPRSLEETKFSVQTCDKWTKLLFPSIPFCFVTLVIKLNISYMSSKGSSTEHPPQPEAPYCSCLIHVKESISTSVATGSA